MDKDRFIANLRRDLHTVMAARRNALAHPDLAAARHALRLFQSERLASTHVDLMTSKETRTAALFFFEELYGTKDFTQRDADLERIIPMMQRLLPASALRYVAEAIELDAMSEVLDASMASKLGEHFTAGQYIEAYRSVGTRSERERQIALVHSVGLSLCELVRMPLIGASLAAMRRPAKIIKLIDLHRFLERGYGAFKQMAKPENFVLTIITRETQILNNIYSGKAEPFKLKSG